MIGTLRRHVPVCKVGATCNVEEWKMSAPDVNVEKQKHRHRGLIWGLWGGALVALVVVGLYVMGAL